MARNKTVGLGEGGRLRAALAAAACLGLLVGCGIETTIYYDKPTFVYSGGTTFTLTHNTANTDSSFRGYDLYYRVYDVSGSTIADTDLSYINSTLQDTNSYTPTSALLNLTNRGFVRLPSGSSGGGLSNDVPLFSIPNVTLATFFTLYADTGSADWYYTVDGALPKTYVVRNNGSSFNAAYEVGEAGYSGTSASSSGDTVYIVLFAVAYGFNFDSTSSPTIFSLPVGAAVYSYTIPF